ncbi:TPA: hypothetical protein EYP13_02145, partial [Candidatus Micrarchaeota archaeon]|nr:hypothetical protein [Candidatus Micrarchaeota archaeon]
MAEKIIQDSVKVLTAIWNEQEKKVCAEEIRKWIQPHVPQISELLSRKETVELIKKISVDAFPEGEWQGAVALNQIIFLGRLTDNPEKAEEILKKFHEVWNRQPLNLSALLVEWRRRTIGSKLDPEIILDTLGYDPSKQSYFDPEISGDGTEFFMNMYKDEFGIDVDALSDSAARIVGEELIRDFFRLVDIDMPVDPEMFVKRVERAVEILGTAK